MDMVGVKLVDVKLYWRNGNELWESTWEDARHKVYYVSYSTYKPLTIGTTLPALVVR